MGLVATGTLAVYAAFGSRPAYAYPAEISAAPGTAGGAGTGASLPVRRFDIPPGPLGTVLDAYRATAQVTVDVTDPGLLPDSVAGRARRRVRRDRPASDPPGDDPDLPLHRVGPRDHYPRGQLPNPWT